VWVVYRFTTTTQDSWVVGVNSDSLQSAQQVANNYAGRYLRIHYGASAPNITFEMNPIQQYTDNCDIRGICDTIVLSNGRFMEINR